MLHYHFIVNPISGKGKHAIDKDLLHQFFDPNIYKISVDHTTYKKQAIELTQQAIQQKPDAIIACGGDGTINEVASCLINTPIPLGIIPVGSGNGLAAHLQIPRSMEKAMALIKNFQLTNIDVGLFNETYFFSNAGLGVEAAIIERYQRVGKRTLPAYIKASVHAGLAYKPLAMKWTIDGVTEEKEILLFFVSNSNEMGYCMTLTPDASLSDGWLDLVHVPSLSMIQKMQLGIAVLGKKIRSFKQASHQQIKEIDIELIGSTTPPYISQIDGEYHPLHTNKISIRINQKALRVIC